MTDWIKKKTKKTKTAANKRFFLELKTHRLKMRG